MLGADTSMAGQLRRLGTEKAIRLQQAAAARRTGELLLAAQAEIAAAELEAAERSLAALNLQGVRPSWPKRLLVLAVGAA